MTVARRRSFPKAFKRDAVERARSSGLPVVTVAAELHVHETVLRRWIGQYSKDQALVEGESAIRNIVTETQVENARLRDENVQLRIEIDRIRAEKETLKRALAIVFAELN